MPTARERPWGAIGEIRLSRSAKRRPHLLDLDQLEDRGRLASRLLPEGYRGSALLGALIESPAVLGRAFHHRPDGAAARQHEAGRRLARGLVHGGLSRGPV